jgi:hypothetical protein
MADGSETGIEPIEEDGGYFVFRMYQDKIRIRAGDILHIKRDGNNRERIYFCPLTLDGKRLDPERSLYNKWEWIINEEIFHALKEREALEEIKGTENAGRSWRVKHADTV